jgi:hypothetical protein
MDEVSRKTLKLFVEKAERLAKYVRENDARNSIVVNPGGLMGVFRNAEDLWWPTVSGSSAFVVLLAKPIKKPSGPVAATMQSFLARTSTF